MNARELLDLTEARRFLQAGLWLQRVVPPKAPTVRPILEWVLDIAASGQPVPPIGFVADLAHVAFLADREASGTREPAPAVGVPHSLVRAYEDHVLGKVYADYNVERATDALRRYKGRNQVRGLTFLVNQMVERTGLQGVLFSPGVVKGLIDASPQETLAQGWEALAEGGPVPLVTELYEGMVAACRRSTDLLGPEDVFELEHGTALAELGQRVALRQLLQAAGRLESSLPTHSVRPLTGRREVPTRVLDEDTYPVGGYSSVANRGSIESLLHSQLAYMEPDRRPDLFDIKYLRDELLYYSRDENQFLRRRRTLVFALWPDLARTRFKDAELPWQRCVLWLAVLVASVRRLVRWLCADALAFEVCFIDGGDPELLTHEHDLLGIALGEQIANGTVRLTRLPSAAAVAALCRHRSRRSLCHCLALSAGPLEAFAPEDTVVSRMVVDGTCPRLAVADEEPQALEAAGPVENWCLALERVLQAWV